MVNVRFEKVKNEYRFIREDGKYWYLDVNDGKWHGIRGDVIKSTPSFSITSYPNLTNKVFIEELPELIIAYPSPNRLKHFDAIFSIVLNENKEDKPIRGFSIWELSSYYENIKFLSEYLRSFEDKERIIMRGSTFREFLFRKKYENYLNYINCEIRRNFISVVSDCVKNLNMNMDCFMEKYGMNLVHYYNKDFFRLLTIDDIVRYYRMCEDLNVAPKKGDFIKNYYEISKIKNAKDEEVKRKKIKENQTRADFSFENEDFYVSVPTTLEEFIELGEEFHNCIGGWELENLILPKTHTLVILRAKDESWKIACDFNNSDFRIAQFYKPCNEPVRTEDFELRKAREIYQSYLYGLGYTLRNK